LRYRWSVNCFGIHKMRPEARICRTKRPSRWLAWYEHIQRRGTPLRWSSFAAGLADLRYCTAKVTGRFRSAEMPKPNFRISWYSESVQITISEERIALFRKVALSVDQTSNGAASRLWKINRAGWNKIAGTLRAPLRRIINSSCSILNQDGCWCCFDLEDLAGSCWRMKASWIMGHRLSGDVEPASLCADNTMGSRGSGMGGIVEKHST
jgi:hypothetical protein